MAALLLLTCCSQGRALSTELTHSLHISPAETQVQPKSKD